MNPELAGLAIDAAFEELGIPDCSYAPPAGPAATGVIAMLMRPDDEASPGDSRVVVGTVRIDVRAADVAASAKGGTFTIGGASYRVIAAPRLYDAARLVWRCEAQAV